MHIFLKNKSENQEVDCSDGLVIKSTRFSSKGPEVSSQHTQSDSQSVSEDLAPSSALCGHSHTGLNILP